MKNQSAANKVIIVCASILACVTVALLITFLVLRTKPSDGHTHSYTETVTSPTCTEWGYTLHSCTCGDSFKDTFVAATGHTSKTVHENEVAANCTTDGSYDEVIYCDVCNEQLSNEHKTVEALGHTPKDAVHENEVAADMTQYPS